VAVLAFVPDEDISRDVAVLAFA